jgi:hypothetical protein
MLFPRPAQAALAEIAAARRAGMAYRGTFPGTKDGVYLGGLQDRVKANYRAVFQADPA